MTRKPIDGLDPTARLSQRAEDSSPRLHGLYDELCKLENLQLVYAQIEEDFQNLGIDALTLEAVEAQGVEKFLQQLSDDLQARTCQPAGAFPSLPVKKRAAGPDIAALRDLVVQATLKLLLDPVFPPDLPCDPEPEKAIRWMAGVIERGFSRIYAVSIEECFDVGQQERLLKRVSQRVGDPEVMDLLKLILAASAPRDSSQRGILVPLLANVAYAGIDRMLLQARAVGREGAFAHVQGARWGNELVILLDDDPRYDWVLPAVKKRLREELHELHYDMDSSQTQSVDLARGKKLRFLGFELRCVTDSQGSRQVHYKRLEKPARRALKIALPRLNLRLHFPRLEFARRCWIWIPWRRPWQLVRNAAGKTASMIQGAYHKVSSIEVGWRHLPIALYPVLAFMFGWRSPLAWLCVVLTVVCNWRSIPAVLAYARRHWQNVIVGACAIAALVCLSLLLSDLYANSSREDRAPHMPPGFYLGQYNLSWDTEPIPYGLYLPPHFQGEKGPFPLIVFLHGYGERTKDKLFTLSLSRSIATQFGEHTRNGRFEFVVFFPIDPTGYWEARAPEVEDAMKALDYVIQRHRIDPARVYLTGISNGGSGVWQLAEVYPDRWAAVAPISSFIEPDVPKVRHIPAWIFHGAQDDKAPVGPQRTLVQELKEAGADVRYTELPNQGHMVGRQLYRSKELYEWFAQKRKAY
jgi:predicted esterase